MQNNPSILKTALVTGGTGAIGKAIARLIAEKDGYEVVVLGRDREKAISTVNELKVKTGNPAISFIIADLSNKQEIRKAANEWTGPLHMLINNAGTTPRQRMETLSGIEMQLATNVLGYFWMMKYFAPLLKKSAPARIVNVASYWAGNLDLDDLGFIRRPYNNDSAYRQSKQADRMLSVAFARRLKPFGITVNACHPGDVNSKLSNQLGFGGHESPEQGAATPVWLATSEDLEGITGSYFEYRLKTNCRFSTDEVGVEELFAVCEKY